MQVCGIFFFTNSIVMVHIFIIFIVIIIYFDRILNAYICALSKSLCLIMFDKNIIVFIHGICLNFLLLLDKKKQE